MNIIETNVVEVEATELQALSTKQTDDAISELNLAQLMLICGGTGTNVLT